MANAGRLRMPAVVSAAAARRPARRPREERKSEIVDVAAEVFCERGYERAAMAEIAARLQVVEGTIYKHFETKRALLSRVLERWYEGIHADTAGQLAGISGDRQRLRYLVWRHLRALADDPKMCRLIFSEVRSEPTYLQSELYRLNKRYTEMLVDVLRAGVKNGSFRRSLPLPLARDLIYGGIEHHVWGYLYGGSSLHPDRLADQICELLCEGIADRQPVAQLAEQTERLAGLVSRLERASRRNGVSRQ